MHADARNHSTAPADLTPPGGPDLAPAGGGLPGAVPNSGNPDLAVEDDFAGNGYTAAQTDSDDSEATADPSSDQGTNADQHARPSLGGRASVSETAAQAPTSTEPVDFAEMDVPGADPGDEVEAFVVESTPAQVAEAKEFFARAKAAESPEQVKRARMQSRVFSVMQYREHPETGEVM
ncbi:MAG: RNA helicase, partial [Agrococcus casei]